MTGKDGDRNNLRQYNTVLIIWLKTYRKIDVIKEKKNHS